MAESKSVLFAGLPGTGKTSYLSLVFLAIIGETRCSIRLGGFADDREHLNAIASKMYRCEESTRTEVSEASGLALSVRLSTDVDAFLDIPDLSGETWRDALEERSLSTSMAELVKAAQGICIFVRVDDFTHDPTIAEADAALSALGQDATDLSDLDTIEHAPDSTQVQLVDLLQVVRGIRGGADHRISLVLSAFDTTADVTPGEWIATNAPLIDQYIAVNQPQLQVEIFGLSAQGGRFDDVDAREALLLRDPVERAFILRADGAPTDIDAPILSALGDV